MRLRLGSVMNAAYSRFPSDDDKNSSRLRSAGSVDIDASAASAALRGGLSKSVYFSRAVLNAHGVGNGSQSEAGAPFGMDRAKE